MTPTTATSSPLASKSHFKILDGLREIAAFMIVIFHFMEIINTDFTNNQFSHGYLAVDFFFCLSGFVIAYSYDDRLGKLGVKKFFTQRFIRLHTLVIWGSILGLSFFLIGPFNTGASNYSAIQILLLFFTSAFLIPNPIMEDRYFNLFGLNAPSWSLFWEYVANIVYAFILFRLPKQVLLAIAIISGGLLVYIDKTYGNILGGWNGETFWHGGARILFSFVAGMCIYRFQWIIKNKIGFLGLSALLMLAFISPYNETYNWILEPFIIVFYFPFIIALGAGSSLSKSVEKFCTLSGELSYPLYMTHYSIMWGFGAYYASNKPNIQTLWIVVPCLIICQILLAYLSLKLVDLPLRKCLRKKWL